MLGDETPIPPIDLEIMSSSTLLEAEGTPFVDYEDEGTPFVDYAELPMPKSIPKK